MCSLKEKEQEGARSPRALKKMPPRPQRQTRRSMILVTVAHMRVWPRVKCGSYTKNKPLHRCEDPGTVTSIFPLRVN